MASANDEILDLMTTRALDLQRLAAGQARDVSRFLKVLEGDIVAQLARIDPTGIGSISRRAARLEKLLGQVKATITASYRTEGKRLANELREIADIEAQFAASAINKGAGVQLITAELTRGQLVAITGDLLVQGAPVSDWISRQAGDTLKRFQDNMRLGIAQGETNSQLIRRIRGGKQGGEVVQGFMNVTRSHAESLVRSATQAVSQASRQAVYNANDDIVKAVQWVSTIDLRTTVQCSARDGLTYTVGTHEPIDHSLPWAGGPGNLHWGCRSTSTPVLKTFRDLGLDIDEVSEGTRASLDGQIPKDTKFEGWLSRRTVAEQDAHLGAGRAKLWRDGKISFRDLMDANGRELSLDELRARL
jgi:SPP1 gp7 family putative phage head morphogenesis protein